MRFNISLVLLLIFSFISLASALEVRLVKRGAISYYMFLPRGYHDDGIYDVLLCLSPSGNGKMFERYHKVTSKYGLVLAASNNFANNIPFESELYPKLVATLISIKREVNVRRLYFCGFSGGGMGSYMLAYYMPGNARGLIILNGAIHPRMRNASALSRMEVKRVAITCGDKDGVVPCDYLEGDKSALESAGIEVKLLRFRGGHTLPPEYVFERALRWVISR